MSIRQGKPKFRDFQRFVCIKAFPKVRSGIKRSDPKSTEYFQPGDEVTGHKVHLRRLYARSWIGPTDKDGNLHPWTARITDICSSQSAIRQAHLDHQASLRANMADLAEFPPEVLDVLIPEYRSAPTPRQKMRLVDEFTALDPKERDARFAAAAKVETAVNKEAARNEEEATGKKAKPPESVIKAFTARAQGIVDSKPSAAEQDKTEKAPANPPAERSKSVPKPMKDQENDSKNDSAEDSTD